MCVCQSLLFCIFMCFFISYCDSLELYCQRRVLSIVKAFNKDMIRVSSLVLGCYMPVVYMNWLDLMPIDA